MFVTDTLKVHVHNDFPISGALGEYDHSARQIRLHPGLAGVRKKVVLAHEIGHAVYGHTESTPVTEREANYFAHWLLVCPHQFFTASRAHHTVEGVAHELEVTPSMVRAYASRWWPNGCGVAIE